MALLRGTTIPVQSESERLAPAEVDRLLDRPPAERAREHRYRCAQAVVFGLPVLALQWLGRSLGGPEAERWVAFLQMLLAGWAVYVGAAGMLSEGLMLWWRRKRITGDFIVALLAAGLYLASLPPVVHLLFTGRVWYGPWFHWSVLLLAVWTGTQCQRWARKDIQAGGRACESPDSSAGRSQK